MAKTAVRGVSAFDEGGLLFGDKARGAAEPKVLIVVNPTGAMRLENPANLVAFVDGEPSWALPVDFRRLTLIGTGPGERALFGHFWDLVDQALCSTEESLIWAPPEGVGRCPRPVLSRDSDWVEYAGARPWVAIAQTAGLDLVMPMNSPRDGPGIDPDRRFRTRVKGSEIEPNRHARHLRTQDSMVDIAHFALLSAAREGWSQEGVLTPEASVRVRSRVGQWPQRVGGLSGPVAIQ